MIASTPAPTPPAVVYLPFVAISDAASEAAYPEPEPQLGPPAPTGTPTAAPTDTPTATPTDTPTAAPTDTPTAAPTSMPPTSTPTATPSLTPEPCRLIFVQDWGEGDSQFVALDLHTMMTNPIGPRYLDADIEGMARHPATGIFYATGRGPDRIKVLYTVASQTGALTPIGNTGFRNLDGLAFRSTDNSLWGWAEGAGLVALNPATGAGTLVFASDRDIEGLAWSNDGSRLYGAAGTHLWVYIPAENRLTRLADNLPGNTEGLEMAPEGVLIGGTHKGGTINLFAYDVTALRPIGSLSVPPYDDIESLVWPPCGDLSAVPWTPIDPAVTPPPDAAPERDGD